MKIFLAAIVLLTGCARALAAGPLVDGAWLARQLGSADLVLIDASPPKAYSAGHIAGAINVDLFSFGADEPAPAEMERRIRSWGIGPGKRVVLYDQGGTYAATSLHGDLEYHGFPAEALFVLDGGLAKWKADGRPVTTEPSPQPVPGTFQVKALRDDIRVDLPAFLAASGDPSRNALVEALEPAMHFGGAKFFDRSGHVPNALMAPPADFFNADKTFKSPEEVRRMLAYLGIRPEQQVYTHCGGGIAASVPFFAATFMAGYPHVKLYKESQLEWLRDDRGLPFWTYDAPFMKRELGWVNGWNNKMMRMFGVSKLTIVDVRPPDAYNLNHIPYALNIPADVFRKSFHDPAKLASVLGPGGVDPSHEAVIVSSGGLNPATALAFLALENAGQEKVSVMLESIDDWGLNGFQLTKDPTILGPPKSPQDNAVMPTKYAVEPRPGIVVKDARAKAGLYPKVLIASGAKAGPAPQDGKLVHVPYTELLDAHGKPKAAAEIWKILTKAGVPRYAELVVFADDPGEAAVNYYVLKLMGYPDVKVLVAKESA